MSVIVFILITGLGVWYYLDYSAKDKDEKNKKATETVQQCGNLEAERGMTSGVAPFSPVLKAKITGNYDRTKAVCQWTINSVAIPDTYPVRGNCVFGGRSFATAGKYIIVYKVAGLSGCPKTVTVGVK